MGKRNPREDRNPDFAPRANVSGVSAEQFEALSAKVDKILKILQGNTTHTVKKESKTDLLEDLGLGEKPAKVEKSVKMETPVKAEKVVKSEPVAKAKKSPTRAQVKRAKRTGRTL
jgi:hypothetical protein